jgi:hypothetical protein
MPQAKQTGGVSTTVRTQASGVPDQSFLKALVPKYAQALRNQAAELRRDATETTDRGGCA